MTDENTHISVRISKKTILDGDTLKLTALLDSFIPDLLEENRNRLLFKVSGYGKDTRELFEIEEVRKYFQKLVSEYEGLFYWIDVKSTMLIFLGLMLYEPVRDGELASLAPGDLEDYVATGLSGLEAFCIEHDLSPESTEHEISRFIKKKIGS